MTPKELPHFNALLTGLMACTPEPLGRLVPEPQRRSRLAQQLTSWLLWCDDLEFARSFAKACPVEGVPPQAYLHRVLEFKGHLLLAGVRFKGGSLAFPFVDLLASTLPKKDEGVLVEALKFIFDKFEHFGPRAIRIWREAEFNLQASGWHLEVDQYFLAGMARDMMPPGDQQDVFLCDVEDVDEATAFVSDAYALLDQGSHSQAMLIAASREDLMSCHASGHLMWIESRLKGRVGLLGTAYKEEGVLHGQCVMEEVVVPSFWGHGAGAASQCLLGELMAQQDQDVVLWGTIDALNTPSLKTALRSGRDKVSAWHWLFPR